MTLKRVLPFFVIILVMTGCYQQASDTFDTVDSSSGSNDADTQVINPTPTEEAGITIIAPGMDDVTPEETPAEIDVVSVEDEPTTEPEPTDVPPTATNPPPPTEDTSAEVVPTATDGVEFITPEPVVEVEIPSATPTIQPTPNPALEPTPSNEIFDEEEPVGECEHVVQSGENAFRIALNNGVTLDDLLAVNGLPPEPIIQPGQRLIIPGCQEGATAASDTVEATEEISAEITAEATGVLEDGYTLHVVASGETLLAIARQYGVTVNAIIAENPDLEDPNRISQGQELLIPPPVE